MILSETRSAPIEPMVMVHLLSYLKRTQNMENDRWPEVVFNDVLSQRKKRWMQQNIKWMGK